ncbi:unnamed protein product [Lota lota]
MRVSVVCACQYSVSVGFSQVGPCSKVRPLQGVASAGITLHSPRSGGIPEISFAVKTKSIAGTCSLVPRLQIT